MERRPPHRRAERKDDSDSEGEELQQPRQKFSRDATSSLRKWLFENIENPYLGHADKVRLTRESGLSRNQVLNWFINVRKVSPVTYSPHQRYVNPLMNKYRGKRSINKILLKLKLKLDSSLDSESANQASNTSESLQPSLPLPSEHNPRYDPHESIL